MGILARLQRLETLIGAHDRRLDNHADHLTIHDRHIADLETVEHLSAELIEFGPDPSNTNGADRHDDP